MAMTHLVVTADYIAEIMAMTLFYGGYGTDYIAEDYGDDSSTGGYGTDYIAEDYGDDSLTTLGSPPNLIKATLREDITLQFDNILADTLPSIGRFTINQTNREYQVVDAEIDPMMALSS